MALPKSQKRTSKLSEEVEQELVNVNVLDSKWGWFVVFNSFICNMIVDGMQYTFANFLMPMSEDLHSSVSSVSLIGSLLSGFYNFSGPLGGALGNKFGFRMVAITGSIVSSTGLMVSYFAPNTEYLYFFYGILGGLGFGMVYMASVITTSLYFEKYRALAASLSVCGTGIGTFVFAPLGNLLVTDYGWRYALICEGGIILVCIICGLSFKPLNIINVIPVSNPASETSLLNLTERQGSIFQGDRKRALGNEAYPTYKEALEEIGIEERRGTLLSTATSVIVGRPLGMESAKNLHPLQLYQIVDSKIRLTKPEGLNRKAKCSRCCSICCFNFWHCSCKNRELTLGDRPMYRDDIFYGGSLTSLTNYDTAEPAKYHLSVTRIPDAEDIEQHFSRKCCVCHKAFLRTCATMIGVNLLKSKIFLFLCISSFMYTMALFIPYVFIRKLATSSDIPEDISVWMVSAIGISNTAGRLISGIVKSFLKVNASVFVLCNLTISGLSSFILLADQEMISLFTFCCIFGFCTAPFVSLRPVIIVDFLGLEKLTNAFGLVLLSQGVASILGPPLAGVIEENTGKVDYTIYLSGSLLLLASISLLVSTLLNRNRK